RRQFTSDRSTARVRRYRERTKQDGTVGNGDETFHGTVCNVTETAMQQDVAPPEQIQSRTDSENPLKPPKGGNGRTALTAGQLAEFETWYGGYPHKVLRGAAEKAWSKARAKASLDEIVA